MEKEFTSFKENPDGGFAPVFNVYLNKTGVSETISFMHTLTYTRGFFWKKKIQKKIFIEVTPFHLNICDNTSPVLGDITWYTKPIVRFDKTESEYLIYTQDFSVPDVVLTLYHEYVVVRYNSLLVDIVSALKPWNTSKHPVYKMTKHNSGNDQTYIVRKFEKMYKSFKAKYPNLLSTNVEEGGEKRRLLSTKLTEGANASE
jgi:hypothetical protein